MNNTKTNKNTRKIATFKTLKITTFTIFPDLVGANYFIFGRYTLAAIRLTLAILTALLMIGFLLSLGIFVVILAFTAGLADFQEYLNYSLIAAFIASAIMGVNLIWTFVNIIIVACGGFIDGKHVRVDDSYKGYQTISRKERALLKKQERSKK